MAFEEDEGFLEWAGAGGVEDEAAWAAEWVGACVGERLRGMGYRVSDSGGSRL